MPIRELLNEKDFPNPISHLILDPKIEVDKSIEHVYEHIKHGLNEEEEEQIENLYELYKDAFFEAKKSKENDLKNIGKKEKEENEKSKLFEIKIEESEIIHREEISSLASEIRIQPPKFEFEEMRNNFSNNSSGVF